MSQKELKRKDVDVVTVIATKCLLFMWNNNSQYTMMVMYAGATERPDHNPRAKNEGGSDQVPRKPALQVIFLSSSSSPFSSYRHHHVYHNDHRFQVRLRF